MLPMIMKHLKIGISIQFHRTIILYGQKNILTNCSATFMLSRKTLLPPIIQTQLSDFSDEQLLEEIKRRLKKN